jgi:ABC-2 type transport system permease protein
MTTATAGTLAHDVTNLRVVASEWTKFRSLRSTGWTVAVALILTVGIGVTASVVAAADPHSSAVPVDVARRAEIGNIFAQLAFGVLAVLTICSEYATGMIRSSMVAVPRRLPVFWGKLAVYVGTVLPITAAGSAVTFLLGQVAWRSKGRPAVSLTDGEIAQIVFGSALYLTVVGICALAIGALVRSTAAGITVVVGVFFLLPTTLQAMPDRVAAYGRFLPSNAGGALWHEALSSEHLAPWTGFGLLCAYAVPLVLAAAWRIKRRDV